MKIITVTLNPCTDINYLLDVPFETGKLNRVGAPSVSVSGKGINVSRMLRELGEESVVLGIFGSDGADEKLRREGLSVVSVCSSFPVRRNTSVLDSNGVQTELNEAGNPVSEELFRDFLGMYKSELNCTDDCIVVLCGSIPPGIDSGIYAKLSRIAKRSGAYVILDASGDALKLGVEGDCDLIKPNREEFEFLIGKKLEGSGEGLRIDALRAALEFYRNYSTAVLLTLGEDGSVYAGGEGSFMCDARKTKLKRFKGAGDTFLAAFIYDRMVKEKDCDISLMTASSRTADYLSR